MIPITGFVFRCLRAGIDLAEGAEAGLAGPSATRECRQTFANLGVGRVLRHATYAPERRAAFRTGEPPKRPLARVARHRGSWVTGLAMERNKFKRCVADGD